MATAEANRNETKTGGQEDDAALAEQAERTAEAYGNASSLAGPLATEPLLDDNTRNRFLETHYSEMDHMGG